MDPLIISFGGIGNSVIPDVDGSPLKFLRDSEVKFISLPNNVCR